MHLNLFIKQLLQICNLEQDVFIILHHYIKPMFTLRLRCCQWQKCTSTSTPGANRTPSDSNKTRSFSVRRSWTPCLWQSAPRHMPRQWVCVGVKNVKGTGKKREGLRVKTENGESPVFLTYAPWRRSLFGQQLFNMPQWEWITGIHKFKHHTQVCMF